MSNMICSHCRLDTAGNHQPDCICLQVGRKTEFEKQIGFEMHETTGNICPKCGHYVGCCSCHEPIIIEAYFPPLKERIAKLESENERLRGIIERARQKQGCLSISTTAEKTTLDILNEVEK